MSLGFVAPVTYFSRFYADWLIQMLRRNSDGYYHKQLIRNVSSLVSFGADWILIPIRLHKLRVLSNGEYFAYVTNAMMRSPISITNGLFSCYQTFELFCSGRCPKNGGLTFLDFESSHPKRSRCPAWRSKCRGVTNDAWTVGRW